MKRVLGIFAIGTAVSVFFLGLNFINSFQIAQEEAFSGNPDIIVPVLIIGVLFILATAVLSLADP
jgi:hypothetical protein